MNMRHKGSRRDPQLEILSVNTRHPSGVSYVVRVPDTRSRNGYDIVDVLMHRNGAVSTRSANRSTSTPLKASAFVRRHIASGRGGQLRDRSRMRRRSRRDPRAPFSVSMTYEVVTPESAEHGDVEDRGYDYEDERMTLTEVVTEVRRKGPWEEAQIMPAYERGKRGPQGALLRLYPSGEGDINYRTGAETRHTLHIRGSDRAIRRLADVLKARRYI